MTAIFPAFEDFEKNVRAGKTQLVWAWVPADLETPLSAYLKLTGNAANSFLLESVEGGATLGRYSVIGYDPDITWSYRLKDGGAPLTDLRALLAKSRIDVIPEELPPMASSGLFGYLGYDMVRAVESIPDEKPDALNLPDCVMVRPQNMAIFDNVKSRLCLSTPVRETNGDARAVYDTAVRRIEKMLDALYGPLPALPLYGNTKLSLPLPEHASVDKSGFARMMEKAVDYIRAGEIFQVVLGIDYKIPFDLPALALYRNVRRTNPSPFLFYMNFGGYQLVGSSPEILVRNRAGRITIRPIAGTRKRGGTRAEDDALAADLLSDPKEISEHLMLLDLGRNDVGRAAKTGTVTVTDKFFVEYYSHVMHIVSNVEGDLRDDRDSLDALFAGFPAGTVSGAPKIRAMQIIEELEPTRRGIYGGCVGYLSGNGDMDTCIALRTGIVKDGHLHVRASAGIVADSVTESEYAECFNKSRALAASANQAVEEALQTKAQKA